jgi:hypothetical protein
MKIKLFEDFNKEEVEINETTDKSTVNESVYPTKKGGPIENSGRSIEVGRLNLKHKGDIIGTLLVWMQPSYNFGDSGSSYDESKWNYGASYTTYPTWDGGRFSDGSTGSGVWSGGSLPKEEALKICKEFLKNAKLS